MPCTTELVVGTNLKCLLETTLTTTTETEEEIYAVIVGAAQRTTTSFIVLLYCRVHFTTTPTLYKKVLIGFAYALESDFRRRIRYSSALH